MKQVKTFTERYYILPWVLNFFLVLFYFFSMTSSFLYTSILDYSNIKADPFDGTVSPIKYVPNYLVLTGEERQKRYEDLSIDQFIEIPHYDAKIISRDISELSYLDTDYQETAIQRLIYTILYMGTYNYDYIEYAGSHPGVDIKAPTGTPVVAIANGVVVEVGNQSSGFGKYILIRHDDVLIKGESKTIYSLYAHLDETLIKEGVKVKKRTTIGKVGTTGTSVSSHLHFQIDIDGALFHPYWPFSGADAAGAGVNFFDAVNIGLGKENALKYTIHPTRFVFDNLSVETKNNLVEKKLEKSDIIIASSNTNDTKDSENNKENNGSPKDKENNSSIKNEENIDEVIIDNDGINETEEEKELDNLDKKENEKNNLDKIAILTDEVNIIPLDNSLDFDDTDMIVMSDIKDIRVEEINDTSSQSSHSEEKEVKIDEVELTSAPEKEISSLNTIKTNTNNLVIKDNSTTLKNNILSVTDNKISTNNTQVFADINSSHNYYRSISYLKNKGVVSGFSDNTFKSSNNIARTEALKMILLGFDREVVEDTKNYFKDIIYKSWERKYVNNAVDLGIVTKDNNYFNPYKNISRVEALKMVIKIGNINIDEYKNHPTLLRDADQNHWSYGYILYAYENDLLEDNNYYFNPDKAITRGELANLIYLIEKSY